jgi:hypothetical protein
VTTIPVPYIQVNNNLIVVTCNDGQSTTTLVETGHSGQGMVLSITAIVHPWTPASTSNLVLLNTVAGKGTEAAPLPHPSLPNTMKAPLEVNRFQKFELTSVTKYT